MTQKEIRPDIADAIRARRDELGLTPNDLYARSGITASGLRPMIEGQVRNWRARTRYGLARALDWPNDAYDRLLAHEVPDETWHREATEPRVVSATGADLLEDIRRLDPEAHERMLAMIADTRAAIIARQQR